MVRNVEIHSLGWSWSRGQFPRDHQLTPSGAWGKAPIRTAGMETCASPPLPVGIPTSVLASTHGEGRGALGRATPGSWLRSGSRRLHVGAEGHGRGPTFPERGPGLLLQLELGLEGFCLSPAPDWQGLDSRVLVLSGESCPLARPARARKPR